MSRAGKVVRILEGERDDAKERVKCLRLQALAWRALAIIAIEKPEYAKGRAQWLMLNSVPYVNGAALEEFLAEHQDMARESGLRTGVFTASTRRSA